MNGSKPILLVEDDDVDVLTVRRAMRDLRLANPLAVTSNGEEALDYLHDPGRPRPCIILLDLNMPRMNGIDFLRVRQNDEALRRIPVVVFTSSREEQDMVQSFSLGVAGYMLKPVDYLQFVETVRVIDLYWTLSQFPADGE